MKRSAMKIEHRGWTITFNPKPIPLRTQDYDVVHDDYDGAPDGDDSRYFTAASVADAMATIDELEEE